MNGVSIDRSAASEPGSCPAFEGVEGTSDRQFRRSLGYWNDMHYGKNCGGAPAFAAGETLKPRLLLVCPPVKWSASAKFNSLLTMFAATGRNANEIVAATK